MTVNSLPREEVFDIKSLYKKEAFKRSIEIFLGCLLKHSSSSTKFNYVCREILEFLELGLNANK